ncbi:MAG: hypothetical protein GF375_06915 [Candidatus Omnitrophica bacterium]|nr:hypothetical protein [Candidatus Omnitrophota bacterium]MBD3269707.1 hypothetical protein [Candidatus Omnitrophota bacterium]
MGTGETLQKFKKYHLDKIIPLCFIFFILMSLELIAACFYSPADELDRILRVLRQDEIIFWELKPSLDTVFQGVKVKTDAGGFRVLDNRRFDRPQDCFTIVCLGGSPTFGWGLDYKYTYTCLLESMLNDDFKGKRYRVINGGIIGYSSYQGRLLFENRILDEFSPDIITVSYLVNDVDKHRFYRNNEKPDKDLKPKSTLLVFLENFLEESSLFLFLRQKILRLKGLDRRFYSEVSQFYPENRRVSPQDYRNQLDLIVDLARARGIEVVFIKMLVRFPFEAEPLAEDVLKRSNENLAIAVKLIKAGKCNQAVLKLKEAVADNPYSAKAYYYLGFCSAMNSDEESAKIYFDKAKKMELLECAIIANVYNQEMEELALERNIELVDIKEKFLAYPDLKTLFVNSDYDLVHPNEKGHRIIANNIYGVLAGKNIVGKN